jgi:uncharacterized membrane protein YeaQ/YmgE (transglycosylase-associated protein family)
VREGLRMMVGLVLWILIGLIAGWAAGKIMKGSGYGILADIGLGIVGAIVGGFLLRLLGVHGYGIVGTTVVATLGAIFLIWLSRLLKKA